jgi:hypothetical protein
MNKITHFWKQVRRNRGADFVKDLLVGFSERRSLPSPTPLERQLMEETKEAFHHGWPLPASANSQAEKQWHRNMARLERLVRRRDLRSFLRWDIIKQTMVMNDAAIADRELHFLRYLPNWNGRWSKAIQESNAGNPERIFAHQSTSGNLVHHAYHLGQFEHKTGRRADDMRYVLEFGGGYGSMCRLFHNLGFAGRYVIFDLPAFSELQKYFLRSLGICPRPTDSFTKDNCGVYCISNPEHLERVLPTKVDNNGSLFIATWSFSESPLLLRERFVPFLSSFGAFLIAYQERFNEVDNKIFFNGMTRRVKGLDWDTWEIEHLPGNYYLVGTTSFPSNRSVPTDLSIFSEKG